MISIQNHQCTYCGARFALDRMLQSHRVKTQRNSKKHLARHCLTTDELSAKGWVLLAWMVFMCLLGTKPLLIVCQCV
jgi:hypothetical protein